MMRRVDGSTPIVRLRNQIGFHERADRFRDRLRLAAADKGHAHRGLDRPFAGGFCARL
jgi:hypothetical protein